MIEVKDITKSYGRHLALDHVSFHIKKGDITGLLGANGAGKSTTMNIITGCLSSDSGEVLINGTSILENPAAAKKNIGYLPEIPPLYNDMTVEKYLRFIFDLKRVRLPRQKHLDQICQKTGISDVRDRIIRHLSKGYRQRIGLAQALVGDPAVLILDEPTVGLDPAQIIEMRKLIKELGEDHTVILSSHILSEVQAVCGKIIIIRDGKIAAQGLTDEMTGSGRGTRRVRLVIEGREQNVWSLLKSIDYVTSVSKRGETEKGCYEFMVESEKDVRRALSRALGRSDYTLLLMQPTGQSLEETFLHIISGNEA